MINIYNVCTEDPLQCDPFIFSGGEPHVQLKSEEIKNSYIWIDARVSNTTEFMTLAVLIDAIRGCKPKWLGLFLPYFPGARQDRRQEGTPFTAKVYADILKKFNLDKIVSLDLHSDVVSAILDIENVPQHTLVSSCISMDNITGLICPDAGAEKKIIELGRTTNLPIAYGRKHREVSTGKLSGFSCSPLVNTGIHLVVDDICDGGGTFNGLIDSIINNYLESGNKFYLWTTHGIFSKGLDDLLSKFTHIFTTDSIPPKVKSTHLTVFPVYNVGKTYMKKGIVND